MKTKQKIKKTQKTELGEVEMDLHGTIVILYWYHAWCGERLLFDKNKLSKL